MARLLTLISLFLGLSVSLFAENSTTPYPALRHSLDSRLQAQLESRIKHLKLDDAVRRGQLAISLVDVTDPRHPSLAQVNGDRMMYAASLPKIAILLAAFERIREGKLKLDTENRELMTNMIRYSSNTAATELIHRVGRHYVNKVLTSPKYRLYDKRYNGGLWVGKEYAKGEAFARDPLHYLSHGATTFQVARFYYLLETGQLVSPQLSREMKKMLGHPGIRHKFVKGLMETSPDAQIYRKSGTWRDWHADSAIVEHGGRTYIAAALAQNPAGGEWLKNLITELDTIILQKPTQAAALSAKRVDG
ncbi:MAG: serine hydrolase [Chromatiaceae bacterium]|nr:serine hydrolase [Gammaproteobacteria bacterium]MCP5305276.1 serine hydrolase [Chromatiaceae bacterium]MCP5315235.1 serine hydrolase [Chromatiaceae bacterium]